MLCRYAAYHMLSSRHGHIERHGEHVTAGDNRTVSEPLWYDDFARSKLEDRVLGPSASLKPAYMHLFSAMLIPNPIFKSFSLPMPSTLGCTVSEDHCPTTARNSNLAPLTHGKSRRWALGAGALSFFCGISSATTTPYQDAASIQYGLRNG